MSRGTRRRKIGNPSKYAWIAVAILSALAVAYSVLLAVQTPGEFWGWVNELLATLLSVAAAFVVGAKLYSFQVRDADDKKREDLQVLVRVELQETLDFLPSSTMNLNADSTKVGETLQQVEASHVQPLILEEAAKSSLFSRSLTMDMLRLAKIMHSYNVQVGQSSQYLDSVAPLHLHLRPRLSRYRLSSLRRQVGSPVGTPESPHLVGTPLEAPCPDQTPVCKPSDPLPDLRRSPKGAWLWSLDCRNISPRLAVLEQVPASMRRDAEQRRTERLIRAGHRLTNGERSSLDACEREGEVMREAIRNCRRIAIAVGISS